MEECRMRMTASQTINVKRIETKILNGRKINVKVFLEVETKVYSNDSVDVISNVNNLDDIQMLNNEKTVSLLLGAGSTKVYAKDTISIDQADDLAEIMKVGIRIVDRDIKISYNKVLAKADADVYIMYLTEDNRIKNVSAKIPIMGFIDIENISEENVCDIDYDIKNLIIKPNNQDAHSIYVEAEIEIECCAYETKNINLIEDLYSISKDLYCKQKEIATISDKKNASDICKVNSTVLVPEIGNNMLYNVQTTPTILNKTVRNGKIIFEGELNLEFIYEVAGGLDARTIDVPFNFEMLLDNIDNTCTIDSNVNVKKDDFIVNNGNVDLNVDLEFNVSSCKNKKLNIIDEIDMEENSDSNIYSMVIYFVKPGDTLWKIAKKFKSTVREISKINKIEDPNKLNIGQQLYIPKFVKSKIAV